MFSGGNTAIEGWSWPHFWAKYLGVLLTSAFAVVRTQARFSARAQGPESAALVFGERFTWPFVASKTFMGLAHIMGQF
jgi:hypothetical protein